jgi:hypothetical protein
VITSTSSAERQYKKLTKETRSIFLRALAKFITTPPGRRGKQWRHLREGHAAHYEETELYSWRAKRHLRLLFGVRPKGFALVGFARRGSKSAGYHSEA